MSCLQQYHFTELTLCEKAKGNNKNNISCCCIWSEYDTTITTSQCDNLQEPVWLVLIWFTVSLTNSHDTSYWNDISMIDTLMEDDWCTCNNSSIFSPHWNHYYHISLYMSLVKYLNPIFCILFTVSVIFLVSLQVLKR